MHTASANTGESHPFRRRKTMDRASDAALAMGTCLNQLAREHIERLIAADQRATDHKAYEARAALAKGQLDGLRFDREGANARD